MDIVSRLKSFINHLGIPVTQFADNCTIPRPTLSQLLNGRNKKVSDELIGKIHDAYPSLSVLWLMFGEGDMLHNKNIETSEPQSVSIFDYSNEQNPEIESSTPSIDFNKDFMTVSPNNFSGDINRLDSRSTPIKDDLRKNQDDNPEKTPGTNTITFNSDNAKKIVNIIIYYSDNSFESFVPNHRQ